MDGYVSLGRVAKLDVKGEGTTFLVVVEEVGDGIPDLSHCRSWRHDDAKELGRDRAVHLGEHGEVVTIPIRT
jgi:hypothetical protein